MFFSTAVTYKGLPARCALAAGRQRVSHASISQTQISERAGAAIYRCADAAQKHGVEGERCELSARLAAPPSRRSHHRPPCRAAGRLRFVDAVAVKEEADRVHRDALAVAEGVHQVLQRRRLLAFEVDLIA